MGGSDAPGGTAAVVGSGAAGGNAAAAGTAGTGGTAAAGGDTAGGTAGIDGTAAAGTPGTEGPCLEFAAPTQVGEAQAPELVALSGMVASREQPGVLYAHADQANSARFFALDVSGTTLGDFTLSGAVADDSEDLAVGTGADGSSWLYLADIGDNPARDNPDLARSEIQVFRVPEPTVTVGQSPVEQPLTNWELLRFTYPDVPYDAEALMVDPVTDALVFVTREPDGTATVLQAPASTLPDTPTVLEEIATIDIASADPAGAFVTAGDISPSGDRVILRTYEAVLVWARGPGSTLAATFAAAPISAPAPAEAQSEGITFSADGNAWYSSGEQQPVIFESLSACQ